MSSGLKKWRIFGPIVLELVFGPGIGQSFGLKIKL
jgi:hypothetical protein